MRYAFVENGVVADCVQVPPETIFRRDYAEKFISAPDDCGPGWTYDGTDFSAPAPPPAIVPLVVTMRQARLALLGAGLLQTVNDAVAAAGDVARIEWEYAQEVRRDWPTLIALQGAVGLSDAQIDALFVAAASL